MTDFKYDPDFPFVVMSEVTKTPIARFAAKSTADAFIYEVARGEVLDTTPIKLPEGIGAVVAIEGSMPLVRVYGGVWVMPMASTNKTHPGYHPLCSPLKYNVDHLTDDDVRELITRAGNKFESIDMVR